MHPLRSLARTSHITLFTRLRPRTAPPPLRLRPFSTRPPSHNEDAFRRALNVIMPLAAATAQSEQTAYAVFRLLARRPVHRQAYAEIMAEINDQPNWTLSEMEDYAAIYEDVQKANGDPVKEREAVEKGMAKYFEKIERAVEDRVEAYRRR